MDLGNDHFEVFYDGQCPLCKREIDMIRKKDRSNKLILTDIAAAGFSPEGIPLDTLMREIHGRIPNGEYVTGVEVFRQIYQRIGFAAFVRPTRLPVIRHFLDIAYKCFAYLRFKHAMHRINKRQCDETGGDGHNACRIATESVDAETDARSAASLTQSDSIESPSQHRVTT